MQTWQRDDGRVLAYTTYGDPDAPPVFYNHGWPSSRLEAGLVAIPGVRLIAVDRPGYGGSTPSPNRRLLDWPADIAALADHLRLDRFAVAGISGGGPYALACGLALPERVRQVILISAVPPPDHAAGSDVALLRLLGRVPPLGRAVIGAGRGVMLSSWFDVRWALRGLPPADRTALTPELLAGLLAAFREGVREGGEGAVSDARILAGDWGFTAREVRVPVQVWHGGEDTVVTVGAVDAFRDIEGIRVTIIPGEGHYSMALRHAPRIIAGLEQAMGR